MIAKDEVLILCYGSRRNNSENSNQNVINFVIKYLQSSGRFDKSIFNGTNKSCILIVKVFLI